MGKKCIITFKEILTSLTLRVLSGSMVSYFVFWSIFLVKFFSTSISNVFLLPEFPWIFRNAPKHFVTFQNILGTLKRSWPSVKTRVLQLECYIMLFAGNNLIQVSHAKMLYNMGELLCTYMQRCISSFVCRTIVRYNETNFSDFQKLPHKYLNIRLCPDLTFLVRN